MKRKFFVLLLSLILVLNFTSIGFGETLTPDKLVAGASILIDYETGEILFGKNEHTKMYPASTTKIMTAILTLENAKLTDKVTIDKETPFVGGSRMYVKEGEIFTVEQLLYALLVDSANDAAVALAKHISGTTDEFAILMNKRAKEIGAINTNFNNPNGLPDENHYTTAYDLAMIGKYAMTIPKFTEIVKTVTYQIPPTEKTDETRYFKNTNRFLWGMGGKHKILIDGQYVNIKYPIVDGIKTGYTNAAGNCLVSTAQKGGRRVISVVLKSVLNDLYKDSRLQLDYGLDNFQNITLINSNSLVQEVEVKNAKDSKKVALLSDSTIRKTFKNDLNAANDIVKDIKLISDIEAPIKKGDILGKIEFKLNNEVIGEAGLVAREDIELKKSVEIMNKIKSFKYKWIVIPLVVLFILWLIRRIIIVRRKRRRRRSRYYL